MKPKTLREALKEKITEEELSLAVTSFDLVGDIAIIEIPPELLKKEKVIADTLLSMHKHLKVVCKKVGVHEGEFRTQKMKVIAGEKRKETEYKENNVRLRLDVEKCYFSPRLSTERKRIMELVKPGEDVLVMFSGVAPYVCVIGKNRKPAKIVGVEINPTAHRYAEENIKINKITNATLYNADVKEIVPLLGKFDRILMPLPRSAEDFLDCALKAAKKGTILHFYDFLHEEKFDEAKEKVLRGCERAGLRCKILDLVKCGQFGPRIFRICVDLEII